MYGSGKYIYYIEGERECVCVKSVSKLWLRVHKMSWSFRYSGWAKIGLARPFASPSSLNIQHSQISIYPFEIRNQSIIFWVPCRSICAVFVLLMLLFT